MLALCSGFRRSPWHTPDGLALAAMLWRDLHMARLMSVYKGPCEHNGSCGGTLRPFGCWITGFAAGRAGGCHMYWNGWLAETKGHFFAIAIWPSARAWTAKHGLSPARYINSTTLRAKGFDLSLTSCHAHPVHKELCRQGPPPFSTCFIQRSHHQSPLPHQVNRVHLISTIWPVTVARCSVRSMPKAVKLGLSV